MASPLKYKSSGQGPAEVASPKRRTARIGLLSTIDPKQVEIIGAVTVATCGHLIDSGRSMAAGGLEGAWWVCVSMAAAGGLEGAGCVCVSMAAGGLGGRLVGVCLQGR